MINKLLISTSGSLNQAPLDYSTSINNFESLIIHLNLDMKNDQQNEISVYRTSKICHVQICIGHRLFHP